MGGRLGNDLLGTGGGFLLLFLDRLFIAGFFHHNGLVSVDAGSATGTPFVGGHSRRRLGGCHLRGASLGLGLDSSLFGFDTLAPDGRRPGSRAFAGLKTTSL